MNNGRPDIALKMFQKALTLKKNNTNQESIILYNIGNIYYDSGREKEAIPYFEKAIQLPPHHSAARYKLAVALANLGDYKKSIENLDKLILKLPENVNSPLNLKGLILAKEKNYKAAFHLFRKCLGIRRDDKNALLNIGALYFLTGDYQRAETFFKIVYAHYPNETFALVWLIDVNIRLNDYKDRNMYMEKLFSKVSVQSIMSLGKALSNKNIFDIGFLTPDSSQKLISLIESRIKIHYKPD